jgi:hypothetical protein
MQFMMCRRKQMKKIFILALVATLGLTGAAFATTRSSHSATPDATFSFGVGGAAAGPTTTNNDDSCDISTAPAATLLLPYFEVETSARAVDTFWTITNVSRIPQIAHVTVWTDWSFPVLDFNIFLTGYDAQSISMYDVIVTGVIAPTPTGSGGTTSSITPGSLSANNLTGNPNFGATINCTGLPGQYNTFVRAAVQNALTNGVYNAPGFGSSCGSTLVGSPASSHTTTTTAVGYVTVDVAAVCSTTLPTTPAYYNSEILFDNVLIGDYQIINKAVGNNYAGGNPMVHIRAIPEGGPVVATGLVPSQTNLPYTFYARYWNASTLAVNPSTINIDRRQPLPSVFAARWIQGGPTAFNTSYRIWREGQTGPVTNILAPNPGTTCGLASLNSALTITEIVRFDAHENPSIFNPQRDVSPVTPITITLPETSNRSTTDLTFPPTLTTPGDDNGWMYLNLNSGTVAGTWNTTLHPGIVRASQNWVIIAMSGAGSLAGQFSVDFDAAWLGNGCSGAIGVSTANSSSPGAPAIGPVGGVPVCPQGDPGCTPNTPPYTGTNVTP